jgi:hypothetical protein
MGVSYVRDVTLLVGFVVAVEALSKLLTSALSALPQC